MELGRAPLRAPWRARQNGHFTKGIARIGRFMKSFPVTYVPLVSGIGGIGTDPNRQPTNKIIVNVISFYFLHFIKQFDFVNF